MTPEATAYHEAGHAVAAFVTTQRGALYASIVPDSSDGTLGHVRYAKFRRDFDFENDYGPEREWAIRRKLEPRVVSAFAGVVAERRFRGGRRHNWRGAAFDLEFATDFILKLEGGGEVANRYSAYLMAQARRLVDAYWDEIEMVAAALVADRTLRDHDIRALIYEAARSRSAQ